MLFGTILVVLISWAFDMQSHRSTVNSKLNELQTLSEEIALHLESHLLENVAISLTLSSAPIIKESLVKSNSEFADFSAEERELEIEGRNEHWVKKTDISDPYIKAHMTNRVAEFFKSQHNILPGTYGEIFLTNRYGVMIATTGKLTTLAHADKYWWKAAFGDGKGRVFLDDRGFDQSVQGYVLGVVIPIKSENEIIGLLKCNINIIGPLTDLVNDFSQRNLGMLQIVRTQGLIVSGEDTVPLSTKVSPKIVDYLKQKIIGSLIISEDNEESQLIAFCPIETTMGSEVIGFGGSMKSIDHIKGNTGEGWHVLISVKEETVIESAHEITKRVFSAGIFFTILTAIAALLLGRMATKPIVEVASVARIIGGGDLNVRSKLSSNDEFGSLSGSINCMAENLQKSMASRDDLKSEVEQRKKAEEKLQVLATTDELTGAYNRRAFNEKARYNFARAKRHNEPMSIFLIDIDHFKKVNDTHGHDVGDMILTDIVHIIMKNIRQEDIVARWGGEEFTVLLPQTGKSASLQLAERLREMISSYVFPKSIHMTVSIGFSELQSDDTVESLIKRADIALYQAKESGRNKVISG